MAFLTVNGHPSDPIYYMSIFIHVVAPQDPTYLSPEWYLPYKIQGLQKQNMICCLMFILKY